MPQRPPDFDPIFRHSDVPITLEEFVAELRKAAAQYESDWKDKPNDFYKAEHLFHDWMGAFCSWMSW